MKLVTVVAILALSQAYAWDNYVSLDLHVPKLNINPNEVHGRIVGGEEAVPNSIPYQVGLRIKVPQGLAMCGGSLISPNYVLTAAHCAEGAEYAEVVLGAHKILEEEPTQIRVNSTDITWHKDWSRWTLQNDIAVIKLPAPVELNENIQLVKLPKRSDADNDFDEVPCTVSGWGKDKDSSQTVSPVLRHVEVPILGNKWCGMFYFGVIQDTHICTNGQDGKSSCSGDSGGPLVVEETKVQIGVVSFGIAFGCEIGWPGAFTRVTSYLDWIEENTDVVIEN